MGGSFSLATAIVKGDLLGLSLEQLRGDVEKTNPD
jgi:hypothetical protein